MKLRSGTTINYNELHPVIYNDIVILTNYIENKGGSVDFYDIEVLLLSLFIVERKFAVIM
jgi:hypothetical protein